jgi:hypothetical protein
MARPVVVERSRAIPVSVEDAFGGTLPIPLPTIFSRRYGPIPPIKQVGEQTGAWDAPGQTRKVMLSGGGSMREELTRLDPPRSFSYTLTDIKGPLGPLVSCVEGEWLFARKGTETEVTWRWTIHPKFQLAAPLIPVFGRLWQGYARQALDELAKQLVR